MVQVVLVLLGTADFAGDGWPGGAMVGLLGRIGLVGYRVPWVVGAVVAAPTFCFLIVDVV